MLDIVDDLRFVKEAGDVLFVVGKTLGEHLDGGLTAKAFVTSQVDAPHAALAEHRFQPVAANDLADLRR